MKRKPRDLRDYTDWTEEDFAEDLRTHPRYQEFYKNYKPDSIEGFIKSYAWTKWQIHKNKAMHYSNADYRQSKFLSAAEDFLQIILQKKLFNVQCLWRANLIDLPKIEYTKDFSYFEKEIWDCPYIEPITEQEVELAIRFLLSDIDDTVDDDFLDWQDYEGFKVWDADDEDDDAGDLVSPKSLYYARAEPIPEFYIYYDTCLNTGHLFNLPDHRWLKEKYYLDAIRDENARLHEEEEARKKAEGFVEPERIPYLFGLSAYGTDRKNFIETCEDDTTKELFAIEDDVVHLRNYDEWEMDAKFLIELRNQGESIALLPHTDWYDAVSKTARFVKRKKTAEMLPYAYQTYMLSFEDEDIETLMAERLARFKFDENDKKRNWLRKDWRETMAEGRALRGE